MEYNQISITAFIKNEKVLYIWLHEFENNPQIDENWEIQNVKLIPHLKRMDLEIKRKDGKMIALVFINFLVHNKKKTMILDELKYELGKVNN